MRVTHERLLELLSYDPKTGKFIWTANAYKKVRLKPAGYRGPKGYVQITIDWRAYKAHHLAWFFVYGRWPARSLDHKNRVRSDNRIKNLREATAAQQRLNSIVRNKSGYRGVCFSAKNSPRNPWVAGITINGMTKYLGCFKTAVAAHRAFVKEYKATHDEFIGELIKARA